MINKKRLAMMAVAASMVLPTNLAYISMVTPVFAEEASADNTDEKTKALDEAFGLEEGSITLNGSKDRYRLPTGTSSFSLTKDIVIDKPLYVYEDNDQTVTIDLGEHSITSEEAQYIFQIWVEGGSLTLTGTGTLTNKTSGESAVIRINQGSLTIDEDSHIKLEATSEDEGSYGISIGENAKTVTKVNNAEIVAQNGIYISGNLTPETGSTLDLKNVKIDAKGHGIYHAGSATTTITGANTNIKGGSVGVEVRAGSLTVSGGTISGSTADPLDVAANGNGSTTLNAGIAVAQHTTDNPIKVEIKDKAQISGYAALAITDPEYNQKDIKGEDDEIEIVVKDATLKGEAFDVAYTEDTIAFSLDGTTVNKDKIQKIYAEVYTNDKGEEKKQLATDGDDFVLVVDNTPPYTFKPASTGTSGGGGNKKPKPKPEEPAEEPMTPVGTPTSMYRLYNRLTGEHLYTIDKNERDNLLTSDTWKDEGEGWIAPSVSDYPVYRLLNPNNGDHHYTTDKNEFDTLPTLGWVAEGIAFFSADKDNTENVLLHRVYNPNATGAGSHHYTADTNERDTLVAQGWKYEGLAWAGLPANK